MLVFHPLITHLLVELTTYQIYWPSTIRKTMSHFTHLTWNECFALRTDYNYNLESQLCPSQEESAQNF